MLQIKGFHDGVTTVSQNATNAINTITIPADANGRNGVLKVTASVSAVAATALITVQIKDGSTVKWSFDLPATAPIGTVIGEDFFYSPLGTKNTAMTIVASASGAAGSIVTLNAQYFTTLE